MQLYLIRHAESVNNSLPTYQRQEDPPITNVGRLQAQCLGNWIKTLSFDVLITSPFLRTLQTTQAVLDAKKSDVHVWDNVFERGGCYRGYNEATVKAASGMGRAAIKRQLNDFSDSVRVDSSIGDDGWWDGRERETDEQALRRAGDVVNRLRADFGNRESVLVVTHADFKRLMLVRLIGRYIDAMKLGPLCNTGVTRITFDDGDWKLDFFNSVSHLPARLITGNEH